MKNIKIYTLLALLLMAGLALQGQEQLANEKQTGFLRYKKYQISALYNSRPSFQKHGQEITENVTSINAEGWPSGAYVWKVISNGKEAESGKWIKQ